MKTSGRSRRAFLRALPPTTVTALTAALIAGAHVVRGSRPITVILAVAVGLTLVVFLTYFSLSFAGYRVKADAVDVPTRYAWPLVGGITVVVMAAAFYLASRFAR
jgi:hypothetical protein